MRCSFKIGCLVGGMLSISILAMIFPDSALSIDRKWIPILRSKTGKCARVEHLEVKGGVEIKLTTPGVYSTTIQVEKQEFQQLSVPGCGATAEKMGLPEMPFKGFFLEIPHGVDISVEILDKQGKSLGTGYKIYPLQPPLPDTSLEKEPSFTLDKEAYSRDVFYPPEPILLESPGIIRGRRVVFVQVFPLQYNPVTTELKAFSSLRFKLKFIGKRDSEGETRKQRLATHESEDLAKRMILNYKESDRSPPPPEPELSTGDAADYLIISYDPLYEEILPLGEWKNRKGFITRVVKMSQVGSTASDVKNYIQNAYDNWNPAPSYVLLVGDKNDVPTNYGNYGYGAYCYTDHPYACVDGSDYYPDLNLGRLSVHTETECTNVVNKILKYDRNPDGGSWYENALIAAYFQDYNEEPQCEADRWFMETSIRILEYLRDTVGMGIETAMTFDNNGCGTYHYWTYSYPHRPSYPDPVPTWVVNLWTGASQSTTDVTNAINSGVGLVQHRDHGGETVWGHPPYNKTNINNLSNGDKTPVIFSINCKTGSFQRTGSDCFAEAFLKKSPGGCIGIVAATRNSYSGWNDSMVHGFYTCMWPSYDSSHTDTTYPHSFRLSEVLNYGKYYMKTYQGEESVIKATFHMFHWFGDPEMELRTTTPQTLSVSHTSPPFGSASIDVNVNQTGALIAIEQHGQVLGTRYSSGGTDTISLSPAITGGYLVYVTANLHNNHPYEDSYHPGGCTPVPTTTPTPTPTPQTASFPFYDGFEGGVFGQGWTVYTDVQGRVRVSDLYPYTGTYSVLLDDSVNDSNSSIAAAILTIDLSGQSDINLDFWWREFGDENHPEDGVFISDDYGGSWYLVLSFNNGPQSYRNDLIDLDVAAVSHGLTLNDHFQIKFQFYDNYSITTDGYAIDDVRIDQPATPTPSPTPITTATPTPTPTITPTPSPSPTSTPVPYIDIGLRAHDGTGIVSFACGTEGDSPLRIYKDGTVYGIILVNPGNPMASGFKIETKEGTKAIRKLE